MLEAAGHTHTVYLRTKAVWALINQDSIFFKKDLTHRKLIQKLVVVMVYIRLFEGLKISHCSVIFPVRTCSFVVKLKPDLIINDGKSGLKNWEPN